MFKQEPTLLLQVQKGPLMQQKSVSLLWNNFVLQSVHSEISNHICWYERQDTLVNRFIERMELIGCPEFTLFSSGCGN